MFSSFRSQDPARRAFFSRLPRASFGETDSLSEAAFTLIEVVVAVAIFAIGMVGVLALFAPVTNSVSAVADAEAASRVADAVRARLQAMPFSKAAALIQDAAAVRKNDADGSYNPADGAKHPAVLFGKLSGDVGIYSATATPKDWYDSASPTPGRVTDADKFFEIDLIRNDTLSPKTNDATASVIAYNLRVRWPAFVRTTPTTGVQSGAVAGGGPVPFDQSKKRVIFFTGFVSQWPPIVPPAPPPASP